MKKLRPDVLTPEQERLEAAWKALRAVCKETDIPLRIHFYDGAHKVGVIYDREGQSVLIMDGSTTAQGEVQAVSIDVKTLWRIMPLLGWAAVEACKTEEPEVRVEY